MTAKELKKKYLDFFVKKGHKKLPNVSLVPAEVDASVLFTTAGMHPLVPYLLGEPHPLGKRLTSNQRCLRTDDIENVGDGFHHTFFEMLGNWSLGDYWKKETISWSWEFLTKVLSINSKKILVSCFEGDKDAPKDEESANFWRSLGVPKERIFFLDKKENWWGPVGQTGPCGPDTEMFFDTGKLKCSPQCNVSCQCGKYIEIWNDVFMQYNRTLEGKYEPLRQKNVDTGMGVERVVAVTSGFNGDNYQTELFSSIIRIIEELSQKKYQGESQKPMRAVADHLRAATFMIADGVTPGNVEQGYILRRLIRQAIVNGRKLGIKKQFTVKVARVVANNYQDEYSHLARGKERIKEELKKEEERFMKSDKDYRESGKAFKVENLAIRLKEGEDPESMFKEVIFPKYKQQIGDYESFSNKYPDVITTASGVAGTIAFDQKSTFGRPIEGTQSIFERHIPDINEEEFDKSVLVFQQLHQSASRKSLEKKFAGGLADHSEVVTKLHTATHLLHQALRDVLGEHVKQVGSNITPERLRFDFTHPEKLTDDQLKQIEEIVNEKIKADLPIKTEMMSLDKAKRKGALAFFAEKYGNKVKVYSIGDYSCEVCGGPHIGSTGEIGGVKIIKERPVGAGRRRIYACLAEADRRRRAGLAHGS